MVGGLSGGGSEDRIIAFLTPRFASTFFGTGVCESEAFLFLLTIRIKVRLEMKYQMRYMDMKKQNLVTLRSLCLFN